MCLHYRRGELRPDTRLSTVTTGTTGLERLAYRPRTMTVGYSPQDEAGAEARERAGPEWGNERNTPCTHDMGIGVAAAAPHSFHKPASSPRVQRVVKGGPASYEASRREPAECPKRLRGRQIHAVPLEREEKP
jgi:hypothetical protein